MRKIFTLFILLTLSNPLFAYENLGKFQDNSQVSKAGEFQIIYDNESPSFESVGDDWYHDYANSHIDHYYFLNDGPGDGSQTGRWIAEGLPPGIYEIEFYTGTDDYPSDARYEIVCADGVFPVTANMNNVAAGWYSLGNYSVNGTCVVNISDYWEGSGTMMLADALRFTHTGTPTQLTTTIPPHIGLCIDDAGAADPFSSSTPIYKLLRLPFSLTIAVIPYKTYSSQTSEEIVARGSEVILHQPMAALSVPNPGTGGITDGMTLSEVRTIVETNLDNMPQALGMNNHMGSLITMQEDKMQVCAEELKERNLFFFDSRTFTKSVAYDVAKNNGILSAERDFFIDGSSKEECKALVRRMANRALFNPHLPPLGIGHVRTNTADALTEIAPELDALGVEVWPISKCMTQVVEVGNVPNGNLTLTGNWQSDSEDLISKELHDGNAKVCLDSAITHNEKVSYSPDLLLGGDYKIFATWVVKPDNSSEIQAVINHQFGQTSIDIDQTESFPSWFYIGEFPFPSGTGYSVELNNLSATNSGENFRFDAFKFVYSGETESSVISNFMIY